MSTDEKNKNWLIASLSILLMTGGCILLNWTINDLFLTTSMSVTLLLSLLSVLIYVIGASLIGRSIRKRIAFHSHGDLEGSMLLAFLLIALGLLMIGFNTELLNPVWKSFFLSWQMLLFVLGAISISRSHFIWGIILSAAGMFFLIEKATVIYPNVIRYEHFTATFWPVVLIVLGITTVLSFFIRPQKCCRRHYKGNWKDDYIPYENENNDGKINFRFLFSGTEQVILDPVFKGGTIEATFGGLQLDLRRTSLAEGKTTLYINAVFGGIEIAAPNNWDIEIISKTFAGGVSDTRFKNLDTDHSRQLILIAKCTFGGITIK